MNLNILLKEIERCRAEMIQLALHKSLSDEKVIEVSKKLDNLLNQYDKMKYHSIEIL
jgi:hypothetical protein